MIIRSGSLPVEPVIGSAPRHEERIGRAGGLTRLGVNIATLQPGERSAQRHWHEEEVEVLYMLEGRAVVVENDGAHEIGPGDICCWPAGVPNAHHILNRSDAPVRYLVAGAGGEASDRCHYPDDGQVLHHAPPRWWVEDDEGRVIREGATD